MAVRENVANNFAYVPDADLASVRKPVTSYSVEDALSRSGGLRDQYQGLLSGIDPTGSRIDPTGQLGINKPSRTPYTSDYQNIFERWKDSMPDRLDPTGQLGISSGGSSPVPAATEEKASTPAATTTATTPATTTTTTPAKTTKTTVTNTATKSTPLTYTPTGMYDPANLQAYNDKRIADVRAMYDAALQNSLASMKTAYEQNMSDAAAYRDKISPQYQQSMNALGSQYEKQRRNNNLQAAASGINTGAGSQMALAQSGRFQTNMANLARSENEALNEANRRIGDLQRNYQNAIAEATANNNYKLAASLLDEYQNAYNRQLNIENTNYQRQQAIENQNYTRAYNEENRDYTRAWNEDERNHSRALDEAARMASYGDFSGYRDLYGDEISKAMELVWALQNPNIAWASGKLSAEEYEKLTGQPPHDVTTEEESAADDLYPMTTSGGVSSLIGGGGSSTIKRSSGSSGRGYSASRDTAYRGEPGHYDSKGNFVADSDGRVIDYSPQVLNSQRDYSPSVYAGATGRSTTSSTGSNTNNTNTGSGWTGAAAKVADNNNTSVLQTLYDKTLGKLFSK